MANYEDGKWVASPIPKGEGRAKKSKGGPSKVVPRNAEPNIEAAQAVAKPKGGAAPRRSGTRVERLVTKHLGAERTVGSGAFKHTSHNLTGDGELRDSEGKDFIKLEIKASGAISAKGEKIYTIKKDELDQMVKEADEAHEKGALVFHFKGQPIDKAYVIMSMEHFKELVDEAKLGRTMRR
jgi:hypothetical protein